MDYEMLAARVTALQVQVESLTRRMDLREGTKTAEEVRTEKPATDYEGNIPRGKYAGKSHQEIVEADPWYVQWLASENKAYGFGFMDCHIEEAQNDPRPDPKARRAR